MNLPASDKIDYTALLPQEILCIILEEVWYLRPILAAVNTHWRDLIESNWRRFLLNDVEIGRFTKKYFHHFNTKEYLFNDDGIINDAIIIQPHIDNLFKKPAEFILRLAATILFLKTACSYKFFNDNRREYVQYIINAGLFDHDPVRDIFNSQISDDIQSILYKKYFSINKLYIDSKGYQSINILYHCRLNKVITLKISDSYLAQFFDAESCIFEKNKEKIEASYYHRDGNYIYVSTALYQLQIDELLSTLEFQSLYSSLIINKTSTFGFKCINQSYELTSYMRQVLAYLFFPAEIQ